MSRSTQYVGLNNYAKKFIKDAIKIEEYDMTNGMFDEIVKGKIYYLNPPEGPNKELILKEILQDSPWSGGPMLFTCLQAILVKENGSSVEMGEWFNWIKDPSVSVNEFDYDTGRYFI